jgi:hypothetical protein
VNKKFYMKWDIDRVREDKFDNWWKDKKHLFIESTPKRLKLKTMTTITKSRMKVWLTKTHV